jgi:signal transduction histidine kinase/CheY-like chemotaxis protein
LKASLWATSVGTALAVMLLGLLVLFGWHIGSATLVQVLPQFAPMQYNTALGFLLCGLGLLLLALDRPRGAAIAGGLAAVLGGLTLTQFVGDFDLGIDQALMQHEITVKTSHPGRMAPNSATCLFLLGLGVALNPAGWPPVRKSVAKVFLSSIAFGLSSVALSGYVTGLQPAYAWGDLTNMAVHTAVGFILLGSGLLALAWSRDIREPIWLPRWLPVPTAVAITTATICFSQALAAEGQRLRLQYELPSTLPNLALIILVVGVLLAAAVALAAHLAIKSSLRAREVSRANLELQREIQTRRAAENALQEHRDNLERVVDERTRDLKLAREQAVAANRAKSEFLSHMSHELRTPLNGILGYAQILQRDPQATNRQLEGYQSIVQCGDHLLSLINDVLDLSKIEAGRLEVEATATDLNKLLRGVGDIVRQRASRKGLAFQIDIAPGVPPGIVVDGQKLRQILVNLLGNAVKFTERGSVVLRVAESPAECLQFQVVDTGVGIAADEQEAIFDPFKQVEAGKAAGGTGLGLAITRRLAVAMGGAVGVQSREGQGSTFTVTLPLVEAATEDWAAAAEEGVPDRRQWVLAEGQQWTILVADDRETNRDILHGMLDAAGFAVRLAEDGQQALELLRGGEPIDLVLMDVRMPRLNGLDAVRQIRDDERLKRMKVIAVTASVFPDFQRTVTAAGFDDLLGKPFRIDDLMSLLEKHLGARFASSQVEPPPTPRADDSAEAQQAGSPCATDVKRLRDALEIKNLTAIKALSEELAANPATAAAGRELGAKMRAFDFAGLDRLADQWEASSES